MVAWAGVGGAVFVVPASFSSLFFPQVFLELQKPPAQSLAEPQLVPSGSFPQVFLELQTHERQSLELLQDDPSESLPQVFLLLQ